jgi:CDP-paratose 2-epimerase
MKIIITGGAGFVGSHVATYYANTGDEIKVFDNLSRAKLLGYEKPFYQTLRKFNQKASQKESFIKEKSTTKYNWNYLKRYENIELIKGNIRDAELIKEAAKDADVIIHTAAQTAVTTSLENPRTDFEVNALGTFNVLEAARLSKNNHCVIFCSTNKVYGDNVNKIPVREKEKRYEFADENYKNGIPEEFQLIYASIRLMVHRSLQGIYTCKIMHRETK